MNAPWIFQQIKNYFATGEVPPAPEPAQRWELIKRHCQLVVQEWGAEEFQRRYGVAWRGFLEFTKSHIRVVSGRGQAAVERVYLETVEGRTKPDEGHILSLWG